MPVPGGTVEKGDQSATRKRLYEILQVRLWQTGSAILSSLPVLSVEEAALQ